MTLLRAANRRPQPWKNGGGTTREVARHPAGSDIDNFGWRLSIADVTESGDFSIFPGVDRHLAILSGAMVFDMENASGQVRTRSDGPIEFPGDVHLVGQVVTHPVQDLNLMVRRGDYRGRLRTNHGAWIACNADVTIVVATKGGVLIVDEEELVLESYDAALIAGCAKLHFVGLWGWIAEVWKAPALCADKGRRCGIEGVPQP